ncbi:hypothetical protein ACP70R_040758 [Stipagrostis hirtigluma subsp. patula]
MSRLAFLAAVLLVAVAAATVSSVHGARYFESLDQLLNNPEAAWLVAGLEAPLPAPVDAAAPGASVDVPLFEEAAYSATVLDNKTPVFGP